MRSSGILYNNKIGFDDRKLMLLMIPLLAFIIPFVFFGLRMHREPYFTYPVFVTTLITTTCIWLGNRTIMIWSRTKFPLIETTKERMKYQITAMVVFTFFATNLLGYLLRGYCNFEDINFPGRTLGDILFNSNSASFLCTLTVVAIYENRYFMSQLRSSVEEKELLKRESLLAQLNALKTQVNPHFLFNNLNTLCSIIPDQPKQAVEFVQELSKVYRHLLEVKDETSIFVKEELDVLKAYAFLLETRFGNNLVIDINVSQAYLQYKIVPLSLQLLMENAIKHNIVSKEKPLKIDVYVKDEQLVVSNNLQKKNQQHDSTGIGLNNIRNRYTLLTNQPIEVIESADSFTVAIPLLTN
jgi:two-component system, LytTR family, sensor kinase